MGQLIEIELVQRTPFLLAYEIIKNDNGTISPGIVVPGTACAEIGYVQLEADAEGWRDRPIHKLVTARIATHADARRVFQGIGLVDPVHASAMRGRLSIVPDTADPWGICAVLRGDRAAILIAVPQVVYEVSAIVTLEIERR